MSNLDLEVVTRFREALVVAIADFPPGLRNIFRSFPTETCRITSDFLAAYLLESGFGDVHVVVNGRRGDAPSQSHAWVEVGECIVDITASQFEDQNDDVVLTTDRTWHDQFEGSFREPISHGFGDHDMEAAYVAIKNRIDSG